jgi:hypothetical protein
MVARSGVDCAPPPAPPAARSTCTNLATLEFLHRQVIDQWSLMCPPTLSHHATLIISGAWDTRTHIGTLATHMRGETKILDVKESSEAWSVRSVVGRGVRRDGRVMLDRSQCFSVSLDHHPGLLIPLRSSRLAVCDRLLH